VAHGIPGRVDRLRSLGNAVVPQIVEEIGRAIMQAECLDNQLTKE
jgi:DNA (cytosine-5)-methyltransferase 1